MTGLLCEAGLFQFFWYFASLVTLASLSVLEPLVYVLEPLGSFLKGLSRSHNF